MPMYDPPHSGEMLGDILEDEEVGWESRHEWRWRWSESVGATQITGCVFRLPVTWRKRGVRVPTRPELESTWICRTKWFGS